ncbi:MAG: hypothetical protein WBR33_05490 [Pseudonocardiaceae bacterium]
MANLCFYRSSDGISALGHIDNGKFVQTESGDGGNQPPPGNPTPAPFGSTITQPTHPTPAPNPTPPAPASTSTPVGAVALRDGSTLPPPTTSPSINPIPRLARPPVTRRSSAQAQLSRPM